MGLIKYQHCFVCLRRAEVWNLDFDWFVMCPFCGEYQIPVEVQEDLDRIWSSKKTLLPYLSAYIHRHSRGNKRVRVDADWERHAREHSSTPMAHKLRRILETVARHTSPGHSCFFRDDFMAPPLDAEDAVEVRYLFDHLRDVGLLTVRFHDIPRDQSGGRHHSNEVEAQMTVKGWEAVSPVAGTGVPGTCFVAMSFDPSLNEAYDLGIVPAVESCGFEVIRLDRVEHNDDITDKILAGIRTAEFMVADFTLQRAGVYFEAGFASGLGRTVIWTCREDDFENLNFDTRQRNHVHWSNPTELRDKLVDRIRATVTLPLASRLSGTEKDR